MDPPQVLLSGLVFGESPRWHDGRLWVADWGAEELIAVDQDGNSEVIASVRSFPFSIDWLPDGRLLIVSARAQRLLRMEADGTLVTHADLRPLSDRPPNNEIVVDGRGNVYVNGGGFDMLAGEPVAPGMIALVAPDGSVHEVASGIEFANGMAVTPDNSTLIVAESYGQRLTAFDIARDGGLKNRRVWADLAGDAPDGICIDDEGAVWYASVPGKHCVRVAEGGERLATVGLDRGAFACMLGGADGRTLFIVAREWKGLETAADKSPVGQILTVTAPAPSAGWP